MALTVDEANAVLRGNFAPWVLELGLAVTAVDAAGAATLAMPGGERVARAQVLKLGRTLAFGEVLIAADGSAETAVQVSSTYALLGAKP